MQAFYSAWRLAIMQAKRVNREEQLKFIMKCRSSGFSDYQWCEAHRIHTGIFCNWGSKLV